MLYPNPVIDRITVRNENGLSVKGIAVHNLIGDKVLELEQHDNTVFDLSILSQGFYLIEVIIGSGKNQFFKIQKLQQ